MKYAIVIPDGCADEPLDAFGGKTPLQLARTPAMDAIAKSGVVGRSNNVPDHLGAGSDVATMMLLGYDVNQYFTGRAPLEAAAQGIQLGADDWAIRCNLVTIHDQTMQDFTAGHISSQEAQQLLADLQAEIGLPYLEFIPGVSYRNLVLFRGSQTPARFSSATSGTPPHDLTDKNVTNDYPRGPGSDLLVDWMEQSAEVLKSHPVNREREKAGQSPATHIWLWGLGKSPRLPSFHALHGLHGKMITAVDLLRGLAALIGWDRIEVPGATGYIDTDYAAKGRYAIDSLSSTDIICVHIEATDEASHEGDAAAKLTALEQIDSQIVAPLHAALQAQGEYRILISPDHPTFLRTKTHSHGFVPWIMCGAGIIPDAAITYDEMAGNASTLAFPAGHELMKFFLAPSSQSSR